MNKNRTYCYLLLSLIVLQCYSVSAVYDLDSSTDFPTLQEEYPEAYPQTPPTAIQSTFISADDKTPEAQHEQERAFIRCLSLPPILLNKDFIYEKLSEINYHFYNFQGAELLNKIYAHQRTYDYGKVHFEISKAFHEYKKSIGDKYYQKNKTHIDATKKLLIWIFSIHGPEALKFNQELIKLPTQNDFLNKLEEFDLLFKKHFGIWLEQNLYKKSMTINRANFILQQALATFILAFYKNYFTTGLGAALEDLIRAFIFQNHEDLLE